MMRAISETVLESAYLITVMIIGFTLLKNGDKSSKLFGMLTLVLGFGDAFHLIPRMIGLLTNTMEQSVAALGFGTLVTSITMTIFYAMLYLFWCGRYSKPTWSVLSYCIFGLAAARILLCVFPQNRWMHADSPLSWGIYRNIPFVILGAIIVFIFFREANRAGDKEFRLAWLAIKMSFLFYIPVVLWADVLPAIGMLMLPKTACYVWLVFMGFNDYKKKKALA